VVALAYVSSPDGAIDAAWLESGRFELDIAGVRVAVRASLKAPYDPSSARTRM
jgi:sarcosine dehydrogenase